MFSVRVPCLCLKTILVDINQLVLVIFWQGWNIVLMNVIYINYLPTYHSQWKACDLCWKAMLIASKYSLVFMFFSSLQCLPSVVHKKGLNIVILQVLETWPFLKWSGPRGLCYICMAAFSTFYTFCVISILKLYIC